VLRGGIAIPPVRVGVTMGTTYVRQFGPYCGIISICPVLIQDGIHLTRVTGAVMSDQ